MTRRRLPGPLHRAFLVVLLSGEESRDVLIRHVPSRRVVSQPPSADVRHVRLLHVESAGEDDLPLKHSSGHRVSDVLALDLADSIDGKGTVVSFEPEVD